MSEPLLRKYEDGSQALCMPAPTNVTTVTLCRGLTLPPGSRTPARFNKGELVTLSALDAEHLIVDGYAVGADDDPNLDETPVPVEILAPISLRGISYNIKDLVFLPAWFA